MPEVPPVPAPRLNTSAAPLVERVAEAFDDGGPLAGRLPHFEPRSGQLEMALEVARVFERGGVLLAEAGTGTGKTLAYLVPAILSGQRVLISTGTKNLQEQIFFKDIPGLRDALGVPFTATYMKGRANYLCLQRLHQLAETGAVTAGHHVFLPIVQEWAARTETGDRAELEDLPEDVPFWNDVAATAESCVGMECPRYEDCFVTKMRQRAAESDVVIVNHHLLCADAAVRQSAFGEVIPACSHLVIDEAHQFEDVTTQYFGKSVSTYRLEDLAHDVEQIASTAAEPQHVRDIEKSAGTMRDASRAFFAELTFAHRTDSRVRSEERVRATPGTLAYTSESAAQMAGALDLAEATLSLAAQAPAGGEAVDPDRIEPLTALARRARELRDDLRWLLRANDADYVFYVEFRGRGAFLRASPIDVSSIVRELFLDRMRTMVLTSATLTVEGSFEYVRSRLGVQHAGAVRLPSEFDFSRQAILYLPTRMPDPRSPEFAGAAGREVIAILQRTLGRAFVLFTSYTTLRAVQAMAEMALHYPILAQGSAPRSQLLKQFRETPHAVLFATASFWQGVDVVGDALSCVIVDKLPFASPADPITAARIDAVRLQGGEPFSDYQVPLAILALQQGLGRLIRHRSDRGVLVVLDPRLHTKRYGERFLRSLPPAPVVRDLGAVSAFFAPDLV